MSTRTAQRCKNTSTQKNKAVFSFQRYTKTLAFVEPHHFCWTDQLYLATKFNLQNKKINQQNTTNENRDIRRWWLKSQTTTLGRFQNPYKSMGIYLPKPQLVFPRISVCFQQVVVGPYLRKLLPLLLPQPKTHPPQHHKNRDTPKWMVYI